jgi:EAL domain-containing protein (putative c-di-GMP-specific phosphodiesterase class I)
MATDVVTPTPAPRGMAAESVGLTWYTHPIMHLADQHAIGYEWLTRPTHGPSAGALWAWAATVPARLQALSEVTWMSAARVRSDHPGILFLNAEPSALNAFPAFLTQYADCAPWVLELTERSLPTARQWGHMQAWAIDLAIDDFGMGDDFMGKLLDWPVQWLKLDRSIVQRCAQQAAYRALIAYLLAVTDERAITVIAEGIETPDEYQAMRGLGIRYGQGYRWGRPRPALHGRWTPPDADAGRASTCVWW